MSNSRNSKIKCSEDGCKFTALFGRRNYIVMLISVCLIVTGFCLMSGPACTMTHFESSVFSTLRIAVAPTLCFIGYLLMMAGIMIDPKEKS